MFTIRLPDRFWAKVKVANNRTDCWLWTGAISTGSRGGYGTYSIRNKDNTQSKQTYKAHRLAYALYNNVTLTQQNKILHACDNPVCCNPYHLSIGTSKSNMIDMVRKGRSTSKLTPTDIVKILSHPKKYGFITKLAKQYKVQPSTISRILNGARWSCLQEVT